MKKIFLYVFLLSILASCKTNLVYISVLVPAPVTVPGMAKTAGIINRSIPAVSNAQGNVHNVLSGQSIAITKEGSAEAIRGLKDALIENKRFAEIKTLDNVTMNGLGAGVFSSPISWDEVAAVSRANNVDIIFVLELFDTELKVNPGSAPDLSTPSSTVNSVLNTDVNFTTIVKTGWRIYDPRLKIIHDESTFNQRFTFTGNAVTAAKTTEVLLGRKETIKKTANALGRDYATQILPYWVRVNRDYYVKGNANFEKATRMARSGNWDKAGEVWNNETTNPKHKIAGRACYNMAIINEINGDLDNAIKWAQKAYEDYNDKLALHYIGILNDRKSENQRLESQQ
jgi:hypothetical protein